MKQGSVADIISIDDFEEKSKYLTKNMARRIFMRTDICAVTLENIDITGGFWYEKQKLIREVSMQNIYKRFEETGRFEAFNFTWREGEENKPHVYWDSDVAKWIEAVGYLSMKKREPELEKIVDSVAERIEKNRMADGYFNSYFGQIEPENRFTRRKDHELYCLGHLIEGAIAYKKGTGKDKLLRLMIDYADLVYDVFYVKKSAAFLTPGHEEIELALVKLYKETGNKKYLDLALYFVDTRGRDPERDKIEDLTDINTQSHLPVRRQRTADGHAVRACYLYSAVADLAKETGDEELFLVAKRLFDNIVKRRMYVTGAIGQNSVGEAFSLDFDLPNQTSYAETCANLSLALFSRRMSLLEPDSVYDDVAERVLYNSFLSGISLDGKSFFYCNIQENDLLVREKKKKFGAKIFTPADTRLEVFATSCCPPNIVRTVSSVQDFQYSKDNDTVYCHQYFESSAEIDGKKISIETNYPYDGEIKISYSGKGTKLALRIPGWCKVYTLEINGKKAAPVLTRGYAVLEVAGNTEIKLTLDMSVRFLEAHPKVWENCGKVALMRGPLVYCVESVDNNVPIRDIRLDKNEKYEVTTDTALGVPVIKTTGYVREWSDELYAEETTLIPTPVRLIPYFAFANRGETNMIIWMLKK